jgi:hypothetical protein
LVTWATTEVTQGVAHHRQIANIVLVELDFELLVERPRVEAGDLAVNLLYQRRGRPWLTIV